MPRPSKPWDTRISSPSTAWSAPTRIAPAAGTASTRTSTPSTSPSSSSRSAPRSRGASSWSRASSSCPSGRRRSWPSRRTVAPGTRRRHQALPVQRPIPVWMGGESEAVLRRAARLADGWITLQTFRPGPAAQQTIDRLHALVRAAGRDPAVFGIEGRVALPRADARAFQDRHPGVAAHGRGADLPSRSILWRSSPALPPRRLEDSQAVEQVPHAARAELAGPLLARRRPAHQATALAQLTHGQPRAIAEQE